MGFNSILRKLRRKEKEARVLILGLDNAGKTTIVKRIFNEDIDTISPTLGFSVRTLEFDGYQLSMWDVGGQRSIRTYWRNYFETTDGLIWVVDSTDRMRLEDCYNELSSLLVEERLAGATLLIFANKQDVDGAMTADEIANVLQLSQIKTRHWNIVPCSARSGQGLEDGLRWLTHDISRRIFTSD